MANILNGLIPEPSEITGSLVGTRGPEGPQGPAGPQGPEGPQGPQGEPGVSGDWDELTNRPFETIGSGLEVTSEGVLQTTGDIGDVSWSAVNDKPFETIGNGLSVNNDVLSTVPIDYDDIQNKPTIPSATSDLINDSGFITSSDIPNWNTLENKPFESIGSGLVVDSEGVISATGGSGASSWSELIDKPFDTIGSGLSVYNDALNVDPIDYSDILNTPTIPENTSELTNDSGFITSAAIPTNVSDFTNDAGYITGINSTDVTTALGYTPYNSSNPNNYITAAQAPVQSVNGQTGAITGLAETSDIPTKVSDLTNDSGFITNADIPDWDTLQSKPFETLGSGLSVDAQGVLSATGGGGGSSDWSDITNKPFSTVGNGLSVTNNVLSADSQLPSISSGDAGKSLVVNSGETGVQWSDVSEVYIGSSTPSGDYTVWIDPNGDAAEFAWSEISNKPFDSVGDGLSVDSSGALNVDPIDYSDIQNTPTIPSKTSDLTNDSGFITKSVNDLVNYTPSSSLAQVATTGSYADLSNKPSIPDSTSDLTNDSGFITNTVNNLTNYTPSSSLAAVATSGSYADLSNKPTIPDSTSDLVNDSGFITSSAIPNWDSLDNKPFEEIGSGLSVDSQGVLSATGGGSSLPTINTGDAGKLLAVNSSETGVEWGPRIVAMTESQYEHITPDPDTYYFLYEGYTLTFAQGVMNYDDGEGNISLEDISSATSRLSDFNVTYPTSITVPVGTTIDLTQYSPSPTNCEEEHEEGDPYSTYDFNCWYDTYTDIGSAEFNELTSITITEDTTIYAGWLGFYNPEG